MTDHDTAWDGGAGEAASSQIIPDDLHVRRTDLHIAPNNQRLIIRPRLPIYETRVDKIISRVLSLSERQARAELREVFREFENRHMDVKRILEQHYEMVKPYMIIDIEPSSERKLLIGSYFTFEYSLESAALFNPSIVPHPDQSNLAEGAMRFILSLRAIGEGHVSSICFREGVITADAEIHLCRPSRYASTAYEITNADYDKATFALKLFEMGIEKPFSQRVLEMLEETFSFEQLKNAIDIVIRSNYRIPQDDLLTRDAILHLARSNYEIQFSPDHPLSQRVIFPNSPNERNGIEDARFVLFTDDNGERTYYATYTAYDGRTVLPQLIRTQDFLQFRIITLNGRAVENKGMALFPRKLNGRFTMLSRQDSENLFLMYSENLHFWNETIPLLKPAYPWEFIKVGNCGSPIEINEGWLVITHGVGAMRKYCIGAVLLDKNDPSHVIGRLKSPLLTPNENEREGYVPNVVYTCGALVHNDYLILPYAMADYASSFAVVELRNLLDHLR